MVEADNKTQLTQRMNRSGVKFIDGIAGRQAVLTSSRRPDPNPLTSRFGLWKARHPRFYIDYTEPT